MSQDDPFANPDAERTVILPSPGRRTSAQPQWTVDAAAPSASTQFVREAVAPATGMNPLVAAANPSLNVVPQLRQTLQHPNPAGLRDQLAHSIKTFETRAKAAGVAPEKIIAARYVLCTLLDEAAASTPWGGSGIWGKHSLLVMFHNEAWGGEKFFQLLSRIAENPGANRDLLELFYACLALGFEGRYRVLENGKAQLDVLRERLAQLLRKQQGEYERDLSPHWQGAPTRGRSLLGLAPLWVGFAICGVILLAVYLSLSVLLNRDSDPAFARIQAIRVKTPQPPVAAPAPKPRLAQFLTREIAERRVVVRDEERRSVATIRGDGLFAPGSATISPEFVPLLHRIAEALNSVPGHVLVTGHTDNQPIRSARFPSNWHLSQERARSVTQLLAGTVKPSHRLSAEGRGDSEPVAANDTPGNRTKNRRVEVILTVAGASRTTLGPQR
jgi:type VI secretion system protein ImpK